MSTAAPPSGAHDGADQADNMAVAGSMLPPRTEVRERAGRSRAAAVATMHGACQVAPAGLKRLSNDATAID